MKKSDGPFVCMKQRMQWSLHLAVKKFMKSQLHRLNPVSGIAITMKTIKNYVLLIG